MNQLAPLAVKQLEAWEKIAGQWLLIPQWRDDQFHMVCYVCDVSVFAASEQSLTPNVFMAATVAHLRNVHRELDPDA
jgi:hypothetical protein